MILHPKNVSRKQAIIEIGNRKRLLYQEKEVIVKILNKYKTLFIVSLVTNLILGVVLCYGLL